MAESFFHTLKMQLIYHVCFSNFGEAERNFFNVLTSIITKEGNILQMTGKHPLFVNKNGVSLKMWLNWYFFGGRIKIAVTVENTLISGIEMLRKVYVYYHPVRITEEESTSRLK